MRGISNKALLMPNPWWVSHPVVKFHEGDDDEDEGEEEESEEESEEDEDEESEEEEPNPKKEKDDKLLKALQAERQQRKDFEKKFKALERERAKKEKGEQSELEEAKSERDTASAQVSHLSELLKKNTVDTAIMAVAAKEKFRDVDDALSLVNRSEIELDFEMDDDGVTIEVDQASVAEAVKKLAQSKPHLILADGDEEGSGAPLGSKKKKRGDKELTEEKLKEQYPSLRS